MEPFYVQNIMHLNIFTCDGILILNSILNDYFLLIELLSILLDFVFD